MTASFWKDRWLGVGPLHSFAPALYNATLRIGRSCSVRDALLNRRWVRDITGATTTQVLCDYLRTWALVHNTVLDPLQSDRFIWKWSPDGQYSVSSTYCAFFAGSTELLGAKELWHTRAPPKVKLFFWLAMHDRLWTADRGSATACKMMTSVSSATKTPKR